MQLGKKTMMQHQSDSALASDLSVSMQAHLCGDGVQEVPFFHMAVAPVPILPRPSVQRICFAGASHAHTTHGMQGRLQQISRLWTAKSLCAKQCVLLQLVKCLQTPFLLSSAMEDSQQPCRGRLSQPKQPRFCWTAKSARIGLTFEESHTSQSCEITTVEQTLHALQLKNNYMNLSFALHVFRCRQFAMTICAKPDCKSGQRCFCS